MADDLLDLARLESGHLAIRPSRHRPAPTIIDAGGSRRRAAGRWRRHLTVTVTDARHGCRCTPTPTGCARSPTTCCPTRSNTPRPAAPSPSPPPRPATPTPSDGWITWTVADTGIGIPAAERPRLFRRFYRASTALDRSIPGTGLGLVITRTIIERHHGTITVTDHTGPGTTFTIALPTKPPPPP